MIYLERLIDSLKKKISKDVPEKFALIFDGWPAGDYNYVEMFDSCPVNNELEKKESILLISYLEQEDEFMSD